VFYVLSKILDILLSPLAWAIALCLYAIPRKKRRRGQKWAALAGALVLYVFSIEPVANALTASLEKPSGKEKLAKKDVVYDAIVLLGGVLDDRSTATHGVPAYNDNIERLLVTFDALRTGRAKMAVISGGPVDASRSDTIEARVLAKQLVDWGIAEDRIVVEDQAKNTRENAVLVAGIARTRGWTSLLMVTSAMHVPRALDCFRAVQLDVDVLPVDYRSWDSKRFSSSWLPRPSFLAESTAVIREAFGRLVYRVQGYGAGA
jgi:uncharacterized SAM-binding protein YcdF (DUF218 family)